MSECRTDQATARIALQIAGGGVAAGLRRRARRPAFPPRNETLAFRQELERLYRDELGRHADANRSRPRRRRRVDQEYIRYRLSGCDNTQATDRVLQQIDGLGIQPTC